MNKNKKKFIQSIINIRDFCLEQDSDHVIGEKYAELINNCIQGYFDDRVKRIPIRNYSAYINFADCAKKLNDELLLYIYEENLSDMNTDWRDLFVLIEDFSKNDEDIF